MSEVARAYLDEVIGIMQQHSIKRLEIDWVNFRATVLGRRPSAQTIADTYPAIGTALGLLGDGHSSYRPTSGSVWAVPNRICTASVAGTPQLHPQIGYVKVGQFTGTFDQGILFAVGIHNRIRERDRADLVGWVVDLRGNAGGNMWPMIAGLGPILGEDTLGYFVDPLGEGIPWEYRDGASWVNGVEMVPVPEPYTLLRERPKVAVLVDNRVTSSGEATFIAFRKRPNTRSFGESTCGLSTSNSGFLLSDGALLNLTVSVMADRSRQAYGSSISPDERLMNDQVVQRAVEWLEESNAMRRQHH
jgi:carboxyl-terminal processing protease